MITFFDVTPLYQKIAFSEITLMNATLSFFPQTSDCCLRELVQAFLKRF